MNMKENAAHVLDLFEAEQQSVLALDPRERGMQHHYSQTMSTCHELRQFIAKLSDTRANTPDSAAQGAMKMLAHELDGAIIDAWDDGSHCDRVCIDTIKRVRDALRQPSDATAQPITD